MFGRITLGISIIIAMLLLAALLVKLTLPEHYRVPSLQVTERPLPTLTAPSWAVVDMTSGELLYAVAATTTRPIASVTKLVTAFVAHTTYDTAATATITWADVAAEGRAGSLVPGESMPIATLLFPLLLESSNDAAATLERVLGEPPLVRTINEQLVAAGIQDTTIADASGLSPDNVSTAADLGALLARMYQTEPHLFDITSVAQYLYADHGWINNNPLAGDAGFAGGKHGFTPEAGKTIAVVFMEDFGQGFIQPVGYVVLGSDDLVADVRALRELVRVSVRYQ